MPTRDCKYINLATLVQASRGLAATAELVKD